MVQIKAKEWLQSHSAICDKHSARLLLLAFLSHKHQFNSISYLPPTCFDSARVKAVYQDPSHIKHSIVTDLLTLKSSIWVHFKTAKILKFPWPHNLTYNHGFLKCHHGFGHKHGSVGSFLPCSNNKSGFTANCICFLQDLCLICCRIWKINEAQKLLEENGLTFWQLKVSQKIWFQFLPLPELLVIGEPFQGSPWCSVTGQPLVLSPSAGHWHSCWNQQQLLKPYEALGVLKEYVLNIP